MQSVVSLGKCSSRPPVGSTVSYNSSKSYVSLAEKCQNTEFVYRSQRRHNDKLHKWILISTSPRTGRVPRWVVGESFVMFSKNLITGCESNIKNVISHSKCFISKRVPTLYDTLGVSQAATVAEIKSAYYTLSKIYHPDRNAGCESSATRFRDITEAYEVLGNFRSRKLYDRGEFHTDENLWIVTDWMMVPRSDSKY